MERQLRFKYFPVSYFSLILGLAGFTVAFQRAEMILGITLKLSHILLILTIGLFVAIMLFYFYKIIMYFDEVLREFYHPVQLNFFPTFSMSFLVLSIALLEYSTLFSRIFWIFGAAVHLVFTFIIVSLWIRHSKYEIKHINPAWFIPVVGNIIVPVAGIKHAPTEISMFFFSIGIIFWLILLVIVFYRVIFHEPMPEKLIPTFFILLAPPAIGFIAYFSMFKNCIFFAKILYYFSLFLFILLIFQYRMFFKIKFYLSWWAYSFPLAALTIATALMFKGTGMRFFSYLALILLTILTIVVAFLVFRTAVAVLRGEICVEEK